MLCPHLTPKMPDKLPLFGDKMAVFQVIIQAHKGFGAGFAERAKGGQAAPSFRL